MYTPTFSAARLSARTITAAIIAVVLVSASAASTQAATPETYAVSHVSQLGDRPFADVAVDESTHDVFAPNYDDGTVSIVNGTTVTSVAVGDYPLAVALNQGTDTAYVLNQGNPRPPSVSVVQGGIVTGTVAVGSNPENIAVDQVDGTIYVTSGSAFITVIEPVTLATSTLSLPSAASSIAVDSATHTLYAGSFFDGTTVFRGGAVLATLPGAMVAFNEVNNLAYTIDVLTDTVYAVSADPATVTVVASGLYSSFLAVNQATGTVYVANYGGDSVTVIDGTTVTATVPLVSAPHAIAVDSVSGAIYVSLRTEARLSVIEGTTVVASPIVGPSTAAVTVDSSTGIAYVVSEDSGILSTVIKTTVEQRPFIVSVVPPAGKAGDAYWFDVLATGNPVPTSYAVTAGTLPEGLTLDGATGAIRGTPTEHGSFPFTLTVANGTAPDAASNYTLVIVPSNITSGPPPTGYVGFGFNFAMTNNLPDPSVDFFITAGPLPTGLTLSTDGVISGTPTTAGSFPVTIHVQGMKGGSSSVSYIMEILTPIPAAITSSAPTSGTVGEAYSFQVVASGVPTAALAIAAGSLPPGLTMDAATGAITGTPTQAGSWPFTLSAASAGNLADTADYTLTIAAPSVAAPAVVDADGLASTGVDARAPLTIAALLVLLGAGALLAARRRTAGEVA